MIDETYKESIGRVVNYLRTTNDLTQEELAIRVQKTHNYIAMIERGERTPSLGLLFKIAKEFDTELHKVFWWADLFYHYSKEYGDNV